MYNLLLYDRLAVGTSYRDNITFLAQAWRRTTQRVGGNWLGDFSITSERLTRGEIVDLYNTIIGWRIVEHSYGPETWEGEIVDLLLSIDGASFRRSLSLEKWHNKVAVKYSGGLTDWNEDTDSSDLHGESCYIDTAKTAMSQTAAEARRDRRLATYAFPRSRPTGGLSPDEGERRRGVSLAVQCAGYAFSMQRRYQTADIAAAALSTQLSTVVGNSEFVAAGSIATNSLSVPVQAAGKYPRLWDVCEELIGMGASGAEYVGGVYPGRVFNYEAAATEVTYYWRNGQLYDAAGTLMLPTHIKTNAIVELANAPRSRTLPGGGTQDQPNRVAIEEVEFIAPNRYRLTPREGPVLEGQV